MQGCIPAQCAICFAASNEVNTGNFGCGEMDNKREQWLRDIHGRQRNTVFPDTLQNESRFWRNISDTPWKTTTLVGLTLLGVFAATWITVFLVTTLQQGALTLFVFLVIMVCFWGPIFAAVAWASHRTLKGARTARRNSRAGR